MSDKPLALSTILPAEPAEPDYDSICSAVMATARGRWFLHEYARRNRTSDTSQVLAAIERIEAVFAGEREQHANQGVRIELLEMARAIAQTRADVAESRPDSGKAPEQSGIPHAAEADISGAAERLRDIAWTMRACGVELGTSEQIEQIAEAILSASSLRDPADHRSRKLGEVLLYLEHRIDRMLDMHMPTPTRPTDDTAPAPDARQPQGDRRDAHVHGQVLHAQVLHAPTPAPEAAAAAAGAFPDAAPAAEASANSSPPPAIVITEPEPTPDIATTSDAAERDLAPVEDLTPPADSVGEPAPQTPHEIAAELPASATADLQVEELPVAPIALALEPLAVASAVEPEPARDESDKPEPARADLDVEPLVVVVPVAAEPAEPPAESTAQIEVSLGAWDVPAPASPSTVDHALDEELAEPHRTAAALPPPVVEVVHLDMPLIVAQTTTNPTDWTLDDDAAVPPVPAPAAAFAQQGFEPLDFSAVFEPVPADTHQPEAVDPPAEDHHPETLAAIDPPSPPEAAPPVAQSVDAERLFLDVVVPEPEAHEPEASTPAPSQPAVAVPSAPVAKKAAAAMPEPDAAASSNGLPAAPPEPAVAPVASQVDQDLQELTELFADPPGAVAQQDAAPAPAPPPESDVLSGAWETAIQKAPVFPDKRADGRPAPSMWEQPARRAAASDEGPADFLLEPMPPIQPSPADAEIESDLFVPPPAAQAATPLPAAAPAVMAAAAAPAIPQPLSPAPVAAPPRAPARAASAKPMPRHGADDPLAALTAMTDEERIALFT